MRSSPATEKVAADVERRADDERIVIYNVSWNHYVTVREALDHVPGLRMTYLDGILEIMSPGHPHEDAKTRIARLIEIYALERDVDLTGGGSTTFKKKAKKRSAEPDECYSIGKMGKVPDIAIEVVTTNPAVDKLDVYEGLAVPEVWIWKDGAFSLFRLGKKGYERIAKSAFLPDLDLAALSKFVSSERSQTEAVRAYRDWLRKG
jgi:Uma2 family endonuclease